MDLECGPDDRARSRVLSFFSLLGSVDVNRLDSTAHLTISPQNYAQQKRNQVVEVQHVP